MNFKSYFFIIIITFMSTLTFAQEKQPFAIGETVSIYSDELNEERTLNIYLPQSYNEAADKKYPVIYLLDGSADEDFIHIAGLVQFGSFSWINMIPETIVVGISNIDRKHDFTYPTKNIKDKEDFPTTGGSKKFIDFIAKELQPFITKNYMVTEERTIIGQSLGGLLASEIFLKKPDLFDHYIIVSPSLWWDDESLLNIQATPYSTKKSIYIGVGKEGKVMETVAKQLHEKLKTTVPPSTQLEFNYFEQLDHGDTLHLAAYDAFKKLFSSKTE